MMIVMDRNTREEYLSQPLQTDNKQIKIAVTFLTGYNGIFIVTKKNKKFYFLKSITEEDGFIQITIPPGAYEIEKLNIGIKRIVIEQEHYTKSDYPFTIKPNFSTLGSINTNIHPRTSNHFCTLDSIRDLLWIIKTTIYEEYNLSPNPVDILSFDNIFLECDIARGIELKGGDRAL